MLNLFSQKFPGINHFHIIKSLTYFEDAEEEVNPLMIEKMSWNEVKERIEEEVKKYLKKYTTLYCIVPFK